MITEKHKGIFAAMSANVIFGLNIPVTKSLVAQWMTPLGYTMTRMFFGTVVFWFIGSFFKREKMVITRNVATKYSPLTVAKWMFLISAFVLLPWSFSELITQKIYSPESTVHAISLLSFALFFSTTLAFFLMPFALKKLEASTVSIFMNCQPVVASVVAIGAGQDTVTWHKGLAALLVLAGVYMVSVNRPKNIQPKMPVNARAIKARSCQSL